MTVSEFKSKFNLADDWKLNAYKEGGRLFNHVVDKDTGEEILVLQQKKPLDKSKPITVRLLDKVYNESGDLVPADNPYYLVANGAAPVDSVSLW